MRLAVTPEVNAVLRIPSMEGRGDMMMFSWVTNGEARRRYGAVYSLGYASYSSVRAVRRGLG